MRRELLVKAVAGGRVVKRVNITGLSPAGIMAAAAALHGQINPEEFYVEDTGAERPPDDDQVDPDDVSAAVE